MNVYYDTESSQILTDNKPCIHTGCQLHRIHPCEVCGRINAVADMSNKRYNSNIKEFLHERNSDR